MVSENESIVREFCLNTSTHGLPGIARSRTVHNCLYWSILFVIFTGTMIYFVTKSIISYLEYPTKMDVNYGSDLHEHFPAISLCNTLAFRFDEFINPFLNYTNARNLTNTNDTKTISINQIAFIGEFLQEKLNKNESLDSFYFPLSSMLIFCSFNSERCSADDFISFTSATYGKCYSFNVKLKDPNSHRVRSATQNGAEGRFIFGIYLHEHQHIPYFVDSIGLVLLIHDNSQLPLIESAGVELIPGRKHKLSYKKKRTNFARSPYTKCTQKISLGMELVFENYKNADYEYSEIVCFQVCAQVYTYDQCGCVNPYLWNARSIVERRTKRIISARFCSFSDLCFKKSFEALFNSSELLEEFCSDCSQQCSMTDFHVQISSSLTPLDWQIEQIKSFVERSQIPLAENWSTNWSNSIRKNYLSINVVRETNIIENHIQSPILNFADLISNVGGQTGLWIGISFLSLMEFVEMIYRLIRRRFFFLFVLFFNVC